MAKDTVTLTQTYQQVAVGAVSISIVKLGTGSVFFNEIASDVNANVYLPTLESQFVQNESKNTFARTNGQDWAILLDGVLT